MHTIYRPHVTLSTLAYALHAIGIGGIVSALTKRWRAHETVRQLNELSDVRMSDIGIHRADLIALGKWPSPADLDQQLKRDRRRSQPTRPLARMPSKMN